MTWLDDYPEKREIKSGEWWSHLVLTPLLFGRWRVCKANEFGTGEHW